MKNILLLIFVSMLVSSVWAQTQGSQELTPEMRRAELRTTLMTLQPRPARINEIATPAPKNEFEPRRLTEQERADLRQQLRPQRGN